MAWGKIDDRLHSHPKFVAAGPVASWAFIASISWSNDYGTDGFIPESQAKKLANKKAISALLKEKLWDATDGGYLIHDFFEDNRNKSAEWWADLKEKRATSGQIGGKTQANYQANYQANHQASAQANAQAKSKPVPVPGTQGFTPPSPPQGGTAVKNSNQGLTGKAFAPRDSHQSFQVIKQWEPPRVEAALTLEEIRKLRPPKLPEEAVSA